MSARPWPVRKVGDLLSLEYGASLPARQRTGGDYPVFGSNGQVGAHSEALVQGPGVIVGRKGSVGEIGWSSGPFWPIDTTYYVAMKDGDEIRWIFHLFDFLQLDYLDSSTGVPGLNRNDVYELTVGVPPRPEQRRIAQILDAVDQAIRHTEAIIAKLEQVKAGLLHDLLTRGLDENGELRDPDRPPEQFKDSPLGRIPREWEVIHLREVVPNTTYGISSRLSYDPGIPVLRMNNLADGEVDLSDLKRSDSSAASDLLLRPGDVLFNRTNSMEHVGRTAIWRGQLGRASFASYLVRLEPETDRLDPEFLNLWLNLPETQLRIRKFATPGVQQVNINPTNLRRTLVALPTVKEQQRAILAMREASIGIAAEARARNKLADVKLGLMQDLLSGKIRVLTERPPAATV